jgi:oxygen-independent coproporphyrinogen III oxidase
MAGIYIHVPFCRQACSYCDFYFVTRLALIPDYVDALIRDIRSWTGSRWTRTPIKTLYFGGGTPSTLDPRQLERILAALHETFDIGSLDEFTFELNPDDARPDYLEAIRNLGVDRLSMGVQSFNPDLLTFMHRSHSRDEALRSLDNIRNAGFRRFSADLIYGNPGQTDAMLEDDIRQLLAFEPPHISAYALTIEESTRLGKLEALGRLQPADDDHVAQQALLLESRLKDAGRVRYEVSNYATKGNEAVHNTNYWRHISYLGIGPGAHSFWHADKEAWRWNNERDLKAWMADPAAARTEPEHLDGLQRAEEYVLLRLRNAEGLDTVHLMDEYDYAMTPEQHAYWDQLRFSGLALPGDPWRLSSEGFNVADRITVDLLTRQDIL